MQFQTPLATCQRKLCAGQSRTAIPQDYMTKMTAVAPGGECPRFMAFLNEITNGDRSLCDFLQRMFGYCITGSTREHGLFFFYGTGANGKSVLLNTVSGILGDYHRTAPIETFTASSFDRHPTELAGLQGRRLVTAIETEEGRRSPALRRLPEATRFPLGSCAPISSNIPRPSSW